MDALVRFVDRYVDRYIEKKDFQRGFDVASRVAARKEGDCTEHAVLLAALARAFGCPARLVLGIALVPWEGRLFAFGHAWVEVAEGGSWRLADAALLPETGARYVPLHVVDDEGPGYGRHMLDAMAAILLVKRIVVERVLHHAEPPPT